VLDLAVGAPYDGPDQRGAVYIFLGSSDGIVKKPSQVSLTVSSYLKINILSLLF
jgi:hypothetical protein